MGNAPRFVISVVPAAHLKSAHDFHREFADANAHIWPKKPEEFEQIAQNGELLGVRNADTGEYVGLCYASFSESTGIWELGGLMIAPSAQQHGLGSLLARYTLLHAICYDAALSDREIIAHVHEFNGDPRKILDHLGFDYVGEEEVPDDVAPKSMRRNKQGALVGHRFTFNRQRFPELANWFLREARKSLVTAGAEFDFGELTSYDFEQAIKEILAELGH